MGNEVTIKEVSGALDIFSTVPRTFEGIMAFCGMLADSELVPKDYRGKPANVAVAIQMGAELGITAMQAIQNIAVVNGRPSVWGDLMKAIVVASPLCELFDEDPPNVALKNQKGRCRVQRRGDTEPYEVTFSVDDAKTAKLWGKDSPWSTNPGRMLQMRARAFACRDKFPDLLKGLHMAEEMIDVTPTSSEPGPIIDPPTATRKETLAKAQEKLKEQQAETGAHTPNLGSATGPATGQATASKPAETKKPEPAKAAAPKADPPKADAPKPEPPKADPPKQDVPKEEPAAQSPADEGVKPNPDNWPYFSGQDAINIVASRIDTSMTIATASGAFNSGMDFYEFGREDREALRVILNKAIARLTSNKR
jgi:hypothetical protein